MVAFEWSKTPNCKALEGVFVLGPTDSPNAASTLSTALKMNHETFPKMRRMEIRLRRWPLGVDKDTGPPAGGPIVLVYTLTETGSVRDLAVLAGTAEKNGRSHAQRRGFSPAQAPDRVLVVPVESHILEENFTSRVFSVVRLHSGRFSTETPPA